MSAIGALTVRESHRLIRCATTSRDGGTFSRNISRNLQQLPLKGRSGRKKMSSSSSSRSLAVVGRVFFLRLPFKSSLRCMSCFDVLFVTLASKLNFRVRCSHACAFSCCCCSRAFSLQLPAYNPSSAVLLLLFQRLKSWRLFFSFQPLLCVICCRYLSSLSPLAFPRDCQFFTTHTTD